MKALWKGGINFGLVSIPVKLYSGSQTHRIELDMIRKKDHCRIEYVRICKKDGKEVPWDDIAKGYKKENGDYVILDKEEIARAMPEKTQTIDIFEFVKEDEIPSKYLEKPYLVEPDKIAQKTYALLRDALRKSGKVGLCKFVIRSSEHLGILTPQDDAIVLVQIRFEQDLRDPDELKLPGRNISISKKELDMAMTIIDQLTDKFEPEKYKDTYKEELLKLIKKKVAAKGKKLPATKDEPKKKERHPADDLLDQLRASLEAIKN